MSGLFAGLMLRQAGLGRRYFREGRGRIVRPRRRHCGAAGTHSRPCAGSGSSRAISACRCRSAGIFDARRPSDRCEHRLPADHDRVGARVSHSARCVSARALPPRQGACARFEQNGGRCDRAFHRRQQRGRLICWSAPTACARPCGSNACRISPSLYAGYVAWRALIAEDAMSRATPSRHLSLHGVLPAAGRADARLSGRRRRTTICGPGIGATTWSGTGRPRRRPIWSRLLTDAQGDTHSISIPPPLIRRARDRSDAGRRRGGCWRRNSWRSWDSAAQPILQPIYDLETAAHGVRARGDHRRRGLCGAPACRRRASPRRRTMRRRWCEALQAARRCREAVCGSSRRAGSNVGRRCIERRAPSRRLFAGRAPN